LIWDPVTEAGGIISAVQITVVEDLGALGEEHEEECVVEEELGGEVEVLFEQKGRQGQKIERN